MRPGIVPPRAWRLAGRIRHHYCETQYLVGSAAGERQHRQRFGKGAVNPPLLMRSEEVQRQLRVAVLFDTGDVGELYIGGVQVARGWRADCDDESDRYLLALTR